MRWPCDTQAPGDPQFKHVSDDRGSKPCERVLWIYVDGKASWKSISVFEVGYCEKYSETSQIVLRSQRQLFTINLLIKIFIPTISFLVRVRVTGGETRWPRFFFVRYSNAIFNILLIFFVV